MVRSSVFPLSLFRALVSSPCFESGPAGGLPPDRWAAPMAFGGVEGFTEVGRTDEWVRIGPVENPPGQARTFESARISAPEARLVTNFPERCV
jgi:hypothetical protein